MPQPEATQGGGETRRVALGCGAPSHGAWSAEDWRLKTDDSWCPQPRRMVCIENIGQVFLHDRNGGVIGHVHNCATLAV
jgi:hypothetical protein